MRSSWVAALAALLVVATPAQAQEKKVIKIGWEQDPQTLSPFTDQDEESYRIWAINYDLLVNFNPDDLSPTPGIAESWDISDDKKTITFKLFDGLKWSDGQPLTSEDVKYSLEVLGGNGLLFTSYSENITSVETPDDTTVIVKTSKPDTRIVGGLFIYIIPKHIWGEQTVKQLMGSYRPTPPIVGSGPLHRHRVRLESAGADGAQPELARQAAGVRRAAVDPVRQRRRRRARAHARRGGLHPRGRAATFERIGQTENVEAVKSPSPSFTELSFNLCPRDICPDARFNPAVQDRTVRQAIAYATDRERINQIASRGTAFPGHGLLPMYYKDFYTEPADDYPYDVEQREPAARRRRLGARRGRHPREGRPAAVVRRLRALGVAERHPGGPAAEGDDGRDRRRVQGPGGQRGQADRADRA